MLEDIAGAFVGFEVNVVWWLGMVRKGFSGLERVRGIHGVPGTI